MRKQTQTALVLLLSSSLFAERGEKCTPTPPTPCNEDTCCRTYCLGPDNVIVNAPKSPISCNGDFVASVSGFYWRAEESGMNYAIKTEVAPDTIQLINSSAFFDADFIHPDFGYDFGFKALLGYNAPCDGWDLALEWTRFHTSSSTKSEAEANENTALLSIWSAFPGPVVGDPLFATDIDSRWKLKLNFVDFELGRKYWNSHRLNLRPHVGLRYANVDQTFVQAFSGGSWSFVDPIVNGEAEVDNHFRGVGLRAGLDTTWSISCGFGLYGDLALSLIYGRFSMDHDEWTREVSAPFRKTPVMELENSFRMASLLADLELGIQYEALFCDCNYRFTAQFGYEVHFMRHQNQMWRIRKLVGSSNDEIDNSYKQLHGDLTTTGWTLSLKLEF